jgi:hypothetical protein
MSRQILFVESDPALSSLCHEALESRGFAEERRGPSVLWLLIGLVAIAGGGWMIFQGLTREAPQAPRPASNVQP